MAKTYTVAANSTFQPGGMSGHRAAWLIDAVPNPLAQTGPKLTLNTQPPNGAVVVGAGNGAAVNFANNPHIHTHGLLQCFAICAAWNKVGDTFTNGYLAHVSAPQHPFCNAAVGQIPAHAFVVVGIGQGAWGGVMANRLANVVPANNIWIYTRAQNGHVGFGIDRYGRFGET